MSRLLKRDVTHLPHRGIPPNLGSASHEPCSAPPCHKPYKTCLWGERPVTTAPCPSLLDVSHQPALERTPLYWGSPQRPAASSVHMLFRQLCVAAFAPSEWDRACAWGLCSVPAPPATQGGGQRGAGETARACCLHTAQLRSPKDVCC